MTHLKKIQAEQIEKEIDDRPLLRLCVTGSVFLIGIVVIGAVVYVGSTGVKHWWQALSASVILVTLVVVFVASTLRTVDKLSEARFMDLMRLTLNQQFALLGEIVKNIKGAFSGEPRPEPSVIYSPTGQISRK